LAARDLAVTLIVSAAAGCTALTGADRLSIDDALRAPDAATPLADARADAAKQPDASVAADATAVDADAADGALTSCRAEKQSCDPDPQSKARCCAPLLCSPDNKDCRKCLSEFDDCSVNGDCCSNQCDPSAKICL
jgi:hypothetical protein